MKPERCAHCQSFETCDAVGHCRHGYNAATAQSPAGVPPEPQVWTDAERGALRAAIGDADRNFDSTLHIIMGDAFKAGQQFAAHDIAELVHDIHRAVKRRKVTPDHGVYGNLRCILDHVISAESDALTAGVPTTEPVAPIAREPDMRRECSCVEVCYQKQGEVLGKNWKCRVEAERASYVARAAAPQAPVEPVAQEPVAWMLVSPRLLKQIVTLDADQAVAMSGEGWQSTPLYASPISLPVEGSRLQDENARLHARINECEQRRKIEYDLGYKAGHADATRG